MKSKIPYTTLISTPWVVICLFLQPFAGMTQNSPQNDVHQVWIKGPGLRKSGYLWDLTDSTLTIGSSRLRADVDLQQFRVENIQLAKFRERRSIMRGIGQGALLGFAVGFVYGLLQGNDPPCKKNEWICLRLDAHEKGLLNSIITTPSGAIIGGVLGSFKTNIIIGKSKSEYSRQREQLEQYRLRQ